MPGKIIMVTGGARSGKSEFAERYVLHYSPKCDYVATAEILDEEMAERVRLHRERRDARWINHEAPYHAERTLEALSAETGAVLFDCLTVYMCNLLYGKDAPEGEFLERCQVVFDEIDKVLAAARNCGKIVVFVTNEVAAALCRIIRWRVNTVTLPAGLTSVWPMRLTNVYYCVAGQAVDVKKIGF